MDTLHLQNHELAPVYQSVSCVLHYAYCVSGPLSAFAYCAIAYRVLRIGSIAYWQAANTQYAILRDPYAIQYTRPGAG
jgi:hypothetical protein